MSRRDPGAATGGTDYTIDPPCADCGDLAVEHPQGRRGGQTVRTGCGRSGCECRRYASAAP